MVAISPSPSPFATILRRSKFASFDPSIAQVYTAYGGDAYRGNWGLKRPIPIRRRGACITVKSIDTPAQQTEWNSGENQAKFMQRYEELNLEPRRLDSRMWIEEFEDGDDPGQPQRLRNPMTFSPKQFHTYLERLRKKRPAFLAYLREQGKKNPKTTDKTLWEVAQQPDTRFHADFLTAEESAARDTMESRTMNVCIHKSGGLMYSRPSFLQTYLTTKPLPGRVLMNLIRYARTHRPGYVVSFAGMTPILWKQNAIGDIQKTRWKNNSDPDRGVLQFRMMSPKVIGLPKVVGKRQGLKGVEMRMEVRDVPPGIARERSNPYSPGSREYVAAFDAPPAKGQPMDITNLKYRMQLKALKSHEAGDALENLKQLISRSLREKK